MVQLSSPTVEMIPVKKGPSPEKSNPFKSGDNGFKTALNEQKEIHDSREEEKRTDSLSSETKKSGRNEENNADQGRTSETEASEKTTEVHDKKTARKLVKSNTSKNTLALGALKDKDSGNEKKSFSPDKAASGLAAAAGQLIPAGVETAEGGVGTDTEMAADIPEELNLLLSSDPKSFNELSLQAGKNASSLLAQEDSAKGEDKDSRSRTLQKSGKDGAELKITVDDRRTVQDRSPLLKTVESDSSSNKLTLELVPSDDVASAMPQGEQSESGKTFSLMSSEEQKGAALLDRQLQDKGTQELTKSIRFVLKDHKEGEIKLILKPEALGKVRINLNLNENNIVGKIIVENNSVRQVFMNNLADLTKALEDSGFGSASLDVSVGDGQTRGGAQYRDEKPVYFTANAMDEMDGQIPVIYEEGAHLSQINLVV